jgi:hypothetical protein
MARFMFVTAIAPAVVIGGLLLSAPRMGGPYAGPSDPLASIVVGGAILVYVVGLAWMIRVYRTDPEAHRSFWRSRRD